MIQLKQLSKSYAVHGRQQHVLNNINLTIERAAIFGILGESGAGKSTLLRCLNLLERPSSGHVYLNNTDLTSLSPQQLKIQRRKIGMIFQHFNLLNSRTAFENIALPLELAGQSKKKIKHTVTELLGLIHLTAHAQHYPDQLSGGQKQRVAIARALATQPELLLCDEPTSSLDTPSTLAILNLLREINQRLSVTIVLITHEMDVIKQICHRAAVISQGQLVEQGTVLQLFAKPQAAMTQQLVQQSLHSELPRLIQQRLQTTPDNNKSRLVRFTFVGDNSDQPLIVTLARQFNITINIIQANIESLQDTTIGFTVCQISGDHNAIDQALSHAKQASVTVEVLGYV
ncbi:MAG TPA: ATP-binding cassette domain-containing protein [Gammaproteobacteria bacterium]|nr:ATP-binding cassette domain-containing protein [Gammaproteobacteria bacterium]